MVLVPNRLVKLTRYITRSATDELFRTMGLEGNEFEQHFEVIYDMLSKVKLSPVLVTEFLSKHILISFLFLQAYVVAAEGSRMALEEGKTAEQVERLSVELADARKEDDDAKVQVG